jgi:cytochrome c oxidase subunit III
MSVMGVFFLFIASVAVSWLWREGVTEPPWLEGGPVGLPSPHRPSATKVGLVIFLAVAACLFSLLFASYFMRMDAPDWRPPPLPRIFWANTVALIASSLALQAGRRAAEAGEKLALRNALLIGGGCAVLFLAGQLWGWRELVADGFYASANPANAFFFLLTGAHGLHLVGGLVALFRASAKARLGAEPEELAASVELCAIYWHFLLLVWLLQLALLAGWANDVGVICRRALS